MNFCFRFQTLGVPLKCKLRVLVLRSSKCPLNTMSTWKNIKRNHRQKPSTYTLKPSSTEGISLILITSVVQGKHFQIINDGAQITKVLCFKLEQHERVNTIWYGCIRCCHSNWLHHPTTKTGFLYFEQTSSKSATR